MTLRRERARAKISAKARTVPLKVAERYRADQNPRSELQLIRQLSVNSAKLSLQAMRLARMLYAFAVVTVFMPSCAVTDTLMRGLEQDVVGPEVHAQRWGDLCVCLIEENIPDELKLQLTNHVQSSQSRSELLPYVKVCNCFQFYNDEGMYRIHLSVGAEFVHLATVVLPALVSLGGTIQFGPSPRTNLEHLTQYSLNALLAHNK